MQFGVFAAIYAPNSAGKAAGEAVVRVDLGAARGGRARSLPCFLVLPASDVDRCVTTRMLMQGVCMTCVLSHEVALSVQCGH